MPGPRRAIAAGGALGALLVLLAACGSTNYNSDLGALASAVEGTSKGQLVHVKCAGTIPYGRQKKFKEKEGSTADYRYYCKGETAGSGAPKSVTKVIRVSLDGKHWHENKTEGAERAQEEARRKSAQEELGG